MGSYVYCEYDTSGHYLTSMSLPSGGDDYTSIVVDNKGNFYLAGDYAIDTLIFGHDTLLPSEQL